MAPKFHFGVHVHPCIYFNGRVCLSVSVLNSKLKIRMSVLRHPWNPNFSKFLAWNPCIRCEMILESFF